MQVSIDSLFDSTGTPVSSSTTTTNTSEKSNGELNKADFLELLCTQLKYQDPLNPQSDTDMAAQLAQYTSLDYMKDIKSSIEEQTESFTKVVSSLQYSALSSTNSSSVSLIGKSVRIKQDTVEYDGETSEVFTVHLGTDSSATVKIVNSDGETVRTLIASEKDSDNSVKLTWNGLCDDGTNAESDTYKIQIDGADEDEQLYCYVDGTVNGVRFTSTGPVLKVDGQELGISNILEIV